MARLEFKNAFEYQREIDKLRYKLKQFKTLLGICPFDKEELKGDPGPQGPPGEKGEDGNIVFEELTSEQMELLRGPQGPQGPQGEKGDKGEPADVVDLVKKDGSNLTLPAFRDNLNIQVSTTNLGKDSKGLIDSNSYWIRDVESTKVLESGKTYTIKVWTKVRNQNPNAYFSVGDQTGRLLNLTKISETEFVGKITMPRDSNGSLVLFREPADSSWYQFEAIKIVEGDMITKDWSPNPDDYPRVFDIRDLTPEQIELLRGPQGLQGIPGVKGDKGDKGDQGIQGLKGEKGDKGDSFKYIDFTTEQINGLKPISTFNFQMVNGELIVQDGTGFQVDLVDGELVIN